MRLGRLALDITEARLGDALGVSFPADTEVRKCY
jgi:hypothetical protein